MRVRIIARFKNEHFIEAREQAGWPTQTAMHEATGIPKATIGAYENFGSYPRTEFACGRLEKIFKCCLEDLFPQVYCDAVDKKLGRPIQKVLTLTELPEWTRPKMIEQSPEEVYDLKELREQIFEAFEVLTEQESKILQMRFGLGKYEGAEYSLGEIADYYRVGPERIRQIEAKALRKLKHPSHSRDLKTFVGIDRHPGFKIRCPICFSRPKYTTRKYYCCSNDACPKERWMKPEERKHRVDQKILEEEKNTNDFFEQLNRINRKYNSQLTPPKSFT